MAFIGNTPTTQAFTPAVDYFSGNGSTTAFTLSRPVASVAQVQVTIDNVAQNPSSAYTVSANTITFTSAPLSGTNNIYVYYTSPITQVIAPGQGTVTATSMASSTGTGAGVFQTSPTINTPTIATPTLTGTSTFAGGVANAYGFGVGTAVPSSGAGIAFPATQSASSDANTLDDYEEGTFTPILTADSGSGWTYSTQIGRYTKIGNVVHIAYVLGLSSKGTMSGSFYLSGLPFTVEDVYSSAEPWGIAFSFVNGLSTSVVSLTGWANNASTLMQVRKQTAAATGWGNSYLDVVDIGASFYIQCSCTYRT